MGISLSGSTIAEFSSEGLTGQKGGGFYRLRFHTRYRVPAYEQEAHHLHSVAADIFLETPNRQPIVIGRAIPTVPIMIRTLPSPQSMTNDFYLDMATDQLRYIEEVRNGGDLRFKVKILGMAIAAEDEHQRSYPMDDTITFEANQKTWTDILKAIGYADYLLFEIPVPPAHSDKRLARAVNELTNAREHYLAGRYGDAVGTCRKVLENLRSGLKHGSQQNAAVKAFRGSREERERLSVHQRQLVVREAATFLTHPALHGSEDDINFTREDAALIITVCSALLSHSLPRRGET